MRVSERAHARFYSLSKKIVIKESKIERFQFVDGKGNFKIFFFKNVSTHRTIQYLPSERVESRIKSQRDLKVSYFYDFNETHVDH